MIDFLKLSCSKNYSCYIHKFCFVVKCTFVAFYESVLLYTRTISTIDSMFHRLHIDLSLSFNFSYQRLKSTTYTT